MNEQPDPPSFFQQHRLKIAIGTVVAIGLIIFFPHQSAEVKKHEPMKVSLLAPPPPPPPPKPPPPPPPKKMIEQKPVAKDEPKPDNTPKQDLGPSRSSGKGTLSGGNGKGGNGGGTQWGWYASSVQNSIAQALKDNPTTRHATIGVTVKIWPDFTGRITRVVLASSTGNPSLDEAIKNQVLSGLSLPGGPPPGMPLPINLRINARP